METLPHWAQHWTGYQCSTLLPHLYAIIICLFTLHQTDDWETLQKHIWRDPAFRPRKCSLARSIGGQLLNLYNRELSILDAYGMTCRNKYDDWASLTLTWRSFKESTVKKRSELLIFLGEVLGKSSKPHSALWVFCVQFCLMYALVVFVLLSLCCHCLCGHYGQYLPLGLSEFGCRESCSC